ncbi:hypothetical protein HUJ05_002465 [Dendroctonus ponderosae]|nr:hypothetical protein HUJ05_002465 [Dendroctonus ponderosae]
MFKEVTLISLSMQMLSICETLLTHESFDLYQESRMFKDVASKYEEQEFSVTLLSMSMQMLSIDDILLAHESFDLYQESRVFKETVPGYPIHQYRDSKSPVGNQEAADGPTSGFQVGRYARKYAKVVISFGSLSTAVFLLDAEYLNVPIFEPGVSQYPLMAGEALDGVR